MADPKGRFSSAWLVAGATSNFTTQIATMALHFIQGVLIARLLGAAGKGIVALVMAGLTVPVLVLGLSLGMAAQYQLARDQRSGPTLVSVLLAYSFGVGGLAALLVIAVAPLFGRTFLAGVDGGAAYLPLVAPLAPALMLHFGLSRLLVSADLVPIRNRIQVIQGAANLVLVAVAVIGFNAGVRGAVVATVAANIGGTLLELAVVIRRYGLSFRWDGPVVRGLFSFGWRQHASSVLTLAFKRVEYFLLAYFLGVAAVGIYSVAGGLINLLLTAARSMQEVAVTAFAANARERSAQMAAQLSRGLLAASLALVVPCGLVGALLIVPVYGPTFAPAIVPFCILLVTVVTYGPGPYLTTYIVSTGRPGLASWVTVAVTAANVALSVALIPHWKLPGNAVATVLAYGLNVVLGIVLFQRFSSLPCRDVVRLTRRDFGAIWRHAKWSCAAVVTRTPLRSA